MTKRVLVAVDGTPASNAALEIACALADNYEAALGLLSVLEPENITDDLLAAAQIEGDVPKSTSFTEFYSAEYAAYTASTTYQDMEREMRASRAAQLLAAMVVEAAEAFSSDSAFQATKTFVRSGDPAKAILDCAAENAADIIIMGHDQQGRVNALFKTGVAEKVQREATCPVLIYSLPKSD